jgi:hypothetical protein
MAETIYDEAKSRVRQAIDFERQSDRYKTENDYFTFPDPNLYTIEKYLFYLLKNSREVEFNNSVYQYRPDYISYDYYGTPSLDKLILFINGIRTVENFVNLKTVLIPSLQSINTILKDNFDPDKDIEDLDAVGW